MIIYLNTVKHFEAELVPGHYWWLCLPCFMLIGVSQRGD